MNDECNMGITGGCGSCFKCGFDIPCMKVHGHTECGICWECAKTSVFKKRITQISFNYETHNHIIYFEDGTTNQKKNVSVNTARRKRLISETLHKEDTLRSSNPSASFLDFFSVF